MALGRKGRGDLSQPKGGATSMPGGKMYCKSVGQAFEAFCRYFGAIVFSREVAQEDMHQFWSCMIADQGAGLVVG